MKFRLLGAGVAALGLLATAFAAQAADIPHPIYKAGPRAVVAYYNWTGFYAGINGGYGWGTSDWDSPAISLKPKGWMFGGTLGYNYQIGSFVWGLEGDFDWADVSASAACGAFVCETKNTWLATARGRVGYAFDRWLPYITGGGAFGHVKASLTDPAVPGDSDTMIGWTVGGGLEYAFLSNWSAKIEYLYVDLGKFNCGVSCAAGMVTDNVTFKENVIRAGLNYKFSGPIFSRY
jgi:outer membrane immunogenic protein